MQRVSGEKAEKSWLSTTKEQWTHIPRCGSGGKTEVPWPGSSPDFNLLAPCTHAMLTGTCLHRCWQWAVITVLLYKELHPILSPVAERPGDECGDGLVACRLARYGHNSWAWPTIKRTKFGINPFTHHVSLLLFGLTRYKTFYTPKCSILIFHVTKSGVNLPGSGKLQARATFWHS